MRRYTNASVSCSVPAIERRFEFRSTERFNNTGVILSNMENIIWRFFLSHFEWAWRLRSDHSTFTQFSSESQTSDRAVHVLSWAAGACRRCRISVLHGVIHYQLFSWWLWALRSLTRSFRVVLDWFTHHTVQKFGVSVILVFKNKFLFIKDTSNWLTFIM